ncbi:transporter substrate-binding domain-containing protein [Niveibacterium sp. 24ML]|uniref:substrate-binding periplasmic protein n=1 Tax=Niveibacterium sp. 24ML TaxID=2985512 RepID=UPI002270086E|nr:transporter substrate-binding domain-containing protein [Niveibacterium sp. 24ML]MCX9158472.1 transporter substrate-binding domain-containing protein [Niveibacterium sp. 24ML]
MRFLLSALLVVLASISTSSVADDRVIRLASLEWPPYASARSSSGGTVTDTVRRALAASGYRLVVEYHAWPNAIALGETGKGFVGYFPTYYSADRDRRAELSDPVGESPLGLAQRADSPSAWATLDDLRAMRLGVVEGYINTASLDRRISAGEQPAEIAVDDASNLMQLAAGRIDLAVIDSKVFANLMGNDPRLARLRGQLAMNSRMLELKSLHVAFRRTPEGRRYSRALSEGLRKIGYQAPVFNQGIH